MTALPYVGRSGFRRRSRSRLRPQTDLRTERKAGRALPGLLEAMLRPVSKTGKAVFLAATQHPTGDLRQKSLNSAISPAKSRLEPGFNLGQKDRLLDGAVAERLKAAVC